MKTPALALILLTISIAVGANHNSVATNAADTAEPSSIASLAVDSVIKVYFVSGMFSPDQRKALWDALQNWRASQKTAGAQITFLDFGETNGLIDCHGCLTVVREEIFASNRRSSSFNRLRQDHTGRLVSAWIGLDRNARTAAGLRDLMLKALERGLGAA